MKILVIKRDEWLRGEGARNSYLLRENDNKKCCLGFAFLACGVKGENILNIKSPYGFTDTGRNFVEGVDWLWTVSGDGLIDNSEDAGTLMTINDDERTTVARREQVVKEVFAKHGVEVIFE